MMGRRIFSSRGIGRWNIWSNMCWSPYAGRLLRKPLLVPGPGTSDDVVEVWVIRLPAELCCDLLRTRDQHGRIARAAGKVLSLDGLAGDPARRLDDLAYREAVPASEVVDEFT